MNDYVGVFADTELFFRFRHPETAALYGDILRPCAASDAGIRVPPEECEDWLARWHVDDPAYAEYVLSCSYACDVLMRRDRMVFHGASFLWHGRAWLFSAPSGTGKTTQLRHWARLYGTEMTILNGDKPILQLCPDGSVLVHPSPWKGKEGLGRDDLTAPLGGVILLRQDTENRIGRLAPAVAAKNLFGRSYSTFSTEAEVLNAVRILEGVLRFAPVWLLRNRGDGHSVRLTRQTLIGEGF